MAETSSLPITVLLSIGSIGVSLYVTLQLLSLQSPPGKWRERLACVALVMLVAGHQLCYAFTLPKAELELHNTIMKCQTALLPGILLSLFLLVAYISRQRRMTPWALGLGAACLGLFLLNMQGSFSLRVGSQLLYEPAPLPWGETVYLLRGTPGLGALLTLGIALSLAIWGGLRCRRIALEGRIRTAQHLSVALAIPPIVILGQWLADSATLYWLDVSGLAWFLTAMTMAQIILREGGPPHPSGSAKAQLPCLGLLPEQQQWEMVVDQSPSCIQVVNLDGKVVKTNLASRRFWQRDLCDDQQGCLLDLLDLNDLDLEIYFADLPQGEHRDIATLELKRGEVYAGLTPEQSAWVRFRAYPLRTAAGGTFALVIYHQDVTSEFNAVLAVEGIARGLSGECGLQFFDNLVLALANLFDAKMAFIGLQAEKGSWSRITTYSLCSEGRIIDNLSYDLADTPCANVVGRHTCVYENDVQRLFPHDLILQDLGIESYIGTPIQDRQNQPIGIMVVMDTKPLIQVRQVQEILEIFAARAGAELQRQDAELKMRQMAYQDYLTRLPNRALLHEHLRDNLEQCRLKGVGAAMYLLDLDHFKTINDTLGHDVGDEVIRGVGRRLREHLDESIFVARMGGDEFVVVHCCEPDQEEAQAQAMADRLIALMTKPLQVGHRLLNAGCSIGVVLYPEGLPTPRPTELDLLRFADIALYQAKSNGRHQYVMFRAELQEKVNARIQIERGLRDALEGNGLELHFQPQVRSNGELVGVEALLRWKRKDGRLISPDSFISVAEETGLILRLGNWVFSAVFAQAVLWQRQGCCPNRISINVSAWQFAQRDFVEQLLTLQANAGVDSHRFVLELTETALLQDLPETISKLQQIRGAGFQVSLDDFGTGYSSLAYLKDLPLDELKIDKSFINELAQGHSHPLLESMIAIGQHMHLGVIAEGIETEQQRTLLEQMGCQIFQGFLYGRPMPADQLRQWLADGSGRMPPDDGDS
ncbi:EAL domain-containing protein [Ferrimonas sediminicola]|uniref:EAL domain-containing protein n=1 Tax=Ferrimonas sediminicola TaxID=2569538 RepID=A0A4U1BC73_9GAMM|nr:EAL domain-containing protein [Ferrimonas sediminicola]TKB48562.1 EAL domain-containing protein [Ferrimonas sediminicola]